VGLKYNGRNVRRKTSGFAKNYLKNNRNSKCVYCDIKLDFNNATADHIVPISNGGNNTQVNLVVCCSDCNNEKGDISFKTYLRLKNKKVTKEKFI
jgi:5-methylcytosine-specific restriction endonuclease McrA